jgi:hypothetical protein
VLGAAALRPVVTLGRRVDRGARRALAPPVRATVLATLDVALGALDAALTSPLTEEAIARIRASVLADDVMDQLRRAAESPDVERLIEGALGSRLFDFAAVQLLDSDGLWILIDRIAQSPAVTAAISQQGLGFADQIADVVRQRSRTADDRLERLARRLARRAPPTVVAPGDDPAS